MGRSAHRAPISAALLSLFLASSPSLAQQQGTEEQARGAYDRGTAAFDSGRYDVAALEFARADELAPNPVALESAIKAGVLADDAVLSMTLADRADRRQPSGALAAAAARARERFGGRVGSVVVRCADARPCAARIDGSQQAIGEPRWVGAGDRVVEIDLEGQSSRHSVRVDAGARVDWRAPLPRAPIAIAPPPVVPTAAPTIPPPAPPVPDRSARRKPLSTTPFWIGAGATVILGGLAAWQGVEALRYNQAYLDDGDDSAEEPGRDAQLRANILLAAAGLVGAGTVVIAVAFVDWSGTPRTAVHAPTLHVRGSF